MKKILLGASATALLVAGFIPSATEAAEAAPVAQTASAQAAPAQAAARCHAHRVGHHWACVTPGSYCPATAHGRYGYAVKTGKRYRCVRYSNGRWRWKRS